MKFAACHCQAQQETAGEKRLAEERVEQGREVPWLVCARQPENVYLAHARHLMLTALKSERRHAPHGSSENPRPFEQDRVSGYSRDIWRGRGPVSAAPNGTA
ncbi:MAG TPA: hypothetical protein VMT19_13525 [Thermoanaerobaculaceae bacterium]|nr:hypothetical protein [Thermoanaerobaculaceae bacterium]